MTRDGTENDLVAVVEMSREFWGHTMYEEPFDPEHVRFMANLALEQGLLAMLEVDGQVQGFTAGVRGPLLGNAAVQTGTEIAWWVNPEARRGRHGIDLVKHIERMAKAAGVKYWNMIVMESCSPEVGATIYERLGYAKSETSYTRIL